MGTASNDQGRAYEYAWINILEEELEKTRSVQITQNSSLDTNKKAWDSLSTEKKETYLISAKSAVDQIIEIEPLMVEESGDTLTLSFQDDSAGIDGDVRDIVVKRDSIDWEIGLSIKHNHEAIKHSRLSHSLDFGKEWFDISCSETYWAEVTPIFNWLKEEKLKGTKWSEIQDKDMLVYVPLLNAFMDELKRAYIVKKDLPQSMIEYLIGKHDYHKIISRDAKRTTIVRSFNVHGTLNETLKKGNASAKIPITKLPTLLLDLRLKKNSTNTVEMILNNGWELSFRIHSASSTVEPSLKFDIQFISMPDSIITYECSWL